MILNTLSEYRIKEILALAQKNSDNLLDIQEFSKWVEENVHLNVTMEWEYIIETMEDYNSPFDDNAVIDILDSLNENNETIYEWWVVSERLEKELKTENEGIINHAWGRKATGQAIMCDYVIQDIFVKILKRRIGGYNYDR